MILVLVNDENLNLHPTKLLFTTLDKYNTLQTYTSFRVPNTLCSASASPAECVCSFLSYVYKTIIIDDHHQSGASRPYHLRASYAFTASRFGPLHNRTFATKASKKASLDTSKTPAVEKLKKLEPTTSVKEALKLAKQKALLSKKIAMAIKSGTSATKVKKQVKKALKAQKERAEAKTLSKIEAPKGT